MNNSIILKQKVDIRLLDDKLAVGTEGQFKKKFVFRTYLDELDDKIETKYEYDVLFLIDSLSNKTYRLFAAVVEEWSNDNIKIVGTCDVQSRGSKLPMSN